MVSPGEICRHRIALTDSEPRWKPHCAILSWSLPSRGFGARRWREYIWALPEVFRDDRNGAPWGLPWVQLCATCQDAAEQRNESGSTESNSEAVGGFRKLAAGNDPGPTVFAD